MAIGSFRKTFWDLFNTPYWYVRIVNDDYRILAEIYTKQTLSKRYIKHKPSKCAYLLPDKLKQVTKKNRIEVTYNYKNAKPLYPIVEGDKEQQKIVAEIKKDMGNIRSRFFKSSDEIPIENLPINTFNDKPIIYKNDIEPTFLYEVLESKFAKEILEIPKSGLDALLPIIALGVVAVMVIGALYLVTGA